MSVNSVNITGNLTRDPQLRQLTNGNSVLDLGIAVNDRRKNPQTGDWEDYPNFVDCSVFGKRAESLARYLRKGQKVAINGKLRYNSWEKDGQKRSKLSVIVDDLEFMSARGEDNGQGSNAGSNGHAGNSGNNGNAPSAPAADVYDDDIPF